MTQSATRSLCGVGALQAQEQWCCIWGLRVQDAEFIININNLLPLLWSWSLYLPCVASLPGGLPVHSEPLTTLSLNSTGQKTPPLPLCQQTATVLINWSLSRSLSCPLSQPTLPVQTAFHWVSCHKVLQLLLSKYPLVVHLKLTKVTAPQVNPQLSLSAWSRPRWECDTGKGRLNFHWLLNHPSVRGRQRRDRETLRDLPSEPAGKYPSSALGLEPNSLCAFQPVVVCLSKMSRCLFPSRRTAAMRHPWPHTSVRRGLTQL